MKERVGHGKTLKTFLIIVAIFMLVLLALHQSQFGFNNNFWMVAIGFIVTLLIIYYVFKNPVLEISHNKIRYHPDFFRKAQYISLHSIEKIDVVRSLLPVSVFNKGQPVPIGYQIQMHDGSVHKIRTGAFPDVTKQCRQLFKDHLPDIEISAELPAYTMSKHSGFDQLMMLMLGMGVIIFLLDYLAFARYFYIKPIPWGVLIICSLLSTLLLWLLVRHQITSRENSQKLVLVSSFTALLIFYVNLPRINRLMASIDPVTVDYKLSEGIWMPSRGDFPVLDLMADTTYWQQFSTGDQHEFEIQKGGLGFWQVDMKTVHDKQKLFYRKNTYSNKKTSYKK